MPRNLWNHIPHLRGKGYDYSLTNDSQKFEENLPWLAINKVVFLAGSRYFQEAARYRAVFLAEIENNQDF